MVAATWTKIRTDFGKVQLTVLNNLPPFSLRLRQVPKWAEMRSKRFASRVLRQKDLGQTIEKYGMNAICMPSIVDLELIFQTTSARFQRLNTSSGIWNDTAEFIND